MNAFLARHSHLNAEVQQIAQRVAGDDRLRAGGRTLRQGRGRAVALAVAGAVGLSVWATWPVAAHLSTHVFDPSAHGGFQAASIRADVRLVLWILAWDVHALTTAPLRLFDANVFHPAAATLALSEHLLGVLPIYAPLALASGSPVFAHQATLLVTFVGAFAAGFALVRVWTGSTAAALLAGSLFAFSPFRGGHLGGLHVLGGWYLPLAILLAWRSATTRGRGAPVGLAVVVALVGLHSMYLAYAALAGLGVVIAVLLATDAGARSRWSRLVGPVAVAAMVIAASALPYLVQRESGALATPPQPFVEAASSRFGHTGATGALLLVIVTCPWWRRGLRPEVRGSWLVALGGGALATHLLAAGPTIRIAGLEIAGPFRLAAAVVPGFASLRIPLRFDAFTTMALATLAGVGVGGVLAALGDRPRRRPAAAAVGLLAVVAARSGLPHPVPLEPIETRATLPPIYAALADAAPGPLLEVPWHDFVRTPGERGAEAVRVYRSVYHWRPLLGGYSGYAPAPYPLVGALVEALPAPQAVRLLARTTGVRQVLLHGAEMSLATRSDWAAAGPSFEVGARAGDDVLLSLVDPPAPDLLPRVRGLVRGPTTLTGTPLAALPPGGRRTQVRVVEAPAGPLARGRPVRVVIEVANASDATWPALAFDAAHRVGVDARWEASGAEDVHTQTGVGRIPWDLAPGEVARVVAFPLAPDVPGLWRLTLGPVQDGVWLDGARALEVRVR